MKIVSYRDGDTQGLGVMVDDDHFVSLASADPSLPSSLDELLLVPGWQSTVTTAVAGRTADGLLAEVELTPLLARPHAIWALALNFKTHILETGLTTSTEFPHPFLRTPTSLVAHRAALVSPNPQVARAFDYEGELLVVIGRPGRHIPVDDALSYVAGYTCCNEGSVREFQSHNRQFGLGKNFEASGSYGPWLVTPDEFGDPAEHRVQTRLNGVLRQDSPLSDMLFSVQQVIHYLSTGYTLQPGDLIVMGTPGALEPLDGDEIGADLSRQYGPIKVPGVVHMVPGDLVEVEIDGIGILQNSVIADPAPLN